MRGASLRLLEPSISPPTVSVAIWRIGFTCERERGGRAAIGVDDQAIIPSAELVCGCPVAHNVAWVEVLTQNGRTRMRRVDDGTYAYEGA